VVLKEDLSPWFVPLSQRPLFIANWAYFPMDFTRSVRQKTRWILGISLQEWERSGWAGDFITKENLVKDRKVFLSSATNFLGYAIFLYFIVYEMGVRGWLPFYWLPVIQKDTPLYSVVLFDTFLMFFRFFQRIVIVGSVYGLTAGLLAVPRMFIGNIVNGYAALRALQIFADARQGKAAVRWDKTDHQEGIGAIPSIGESEVTDADDRLILRQSTEDLLALLRSPDTWAIVDALELIPHDVNDEDRAAFMVELNRLSRHDDNLVRAICGRSIGYLKWQELRDTAVRLLHDRDWIVRGNAAIAVVKYPDYLHLLDSVVRGGDRFAAEVLIRTIEQNPIKRDELMRALVNNELVHSRSSILEHSPHLGAPDALA
jgi:adsorption protein B